MRGSDIMEEETKTKEEEKDFLLSWIKIFDFEINLYETFLEKEI